MLPGEQVEVAIAEEGRLQEYYLDMFHQRKLKGNIYKGVIHNIDTNLQAAFRELRRGARTASSRSTRSTPNTG